MKPATIILRGKHAVQARVTPCALVLGMATCWATTSLHAQDTPPSVYFPTSQEENVVNPELRRWSPPRNMWPQEPAETLDPELFEDPQNRVETKYTSSPDVKVKPKETEGVYTDQEEKDLYQADYENDRPSELWPDQTTETGGQGATPTVTYSEKVRYTATSREGGNYAEPISATPARGGSVAPTTYYLTEYEEELFQRDTIGETSEALWAEELWSPSRVASPYDAAPFLFQPLDETLRAVSWGPSWNGNRSRERYWNAQRYNPHPGRETTSQLNNYYRFVQPNNSFGRFDRRGGLHADFGNTYGDRNRFTYEGGVGIGTQVSPVAFRRYLTAPVLKAGPVILDDLSLSASLLYTNFDGELPSGIANEGFIGIISLGGSLLVQLTENFYLTVSGNVYYLPTEDDWGFGFGNGFGGGLGLDPVTFARLNYEWEMFDWDWLLYDEFSVGHRNGGNIFYNVGAIGSDGGIDQVGRFSFGNPARSTSYQDAESGADFTFDTENIAFGNAIGILGTGLFAKDWRGITSLTRGDYWDRNFDEHTADHSFTIRADYVSPTSRWHPFAQYSLFTDEDFEEYTHTVQVGTHVEVTENVSADGSIGYFWTSGEEQRNRSDSFLWEAGVYHRITQHLEHSLRVGNTYARSDFGDEYLARFIRYNITAELGAFTNLSLFAQFADTENLDDEDDSRDTFIAGANLTRKLGDHVDAYAQVYYFENDYHLDDRGTSDGVSAQIGFNSQFLPNWFLGGFYRYTDQNGTFAEDTFTEHVVLATLTRRF